MRIRAEKEIEQTKNADKVSKPESMQLSVTEDSKR